MDATASSDLSLPESYALPASFLPPLWRKMQVGEKPPQFSPTPRPSPVEGEEI